MRLKFSYKSVPLLQSLVLLCLFLATLNFVNRYYYCAFIAFGLFCIGKKGRISVKISAGVSLLILALSWVLFAPGLLSSVFNILKPLVYILCYIMGYSMMETDTEKEEPDYKKFCLFVCIIAAGPFIHYLLNWVTNFDTYESRNTVDIWTKTVIAATGQAALACLPLALALVGIFSKNSWRIKALSIGVLAVVLGYNLILSGRTLFVLLIIGATVAFLYQVLQEQKKKFRTVFIFALIILVIVFIYNTNLFGIRAFIEESPFYERFFGKKGIDLDEDGRLDKKLYHLKNMLNYPFGGAHIREQTGHAHDIYLDTYDEAGIFALLGLGLYILQALVCACKCILNKHLPFAFRQTILCLYLLVLVEFMVEPILQGMPWLFASFCFIDGCTGRILQDLKVRSRRKL